ncbi:hypothetical protein LPU83_pLPU83c_0611 (plasmid) [Rhizobium favelukesii]|uniref:Uncharacterized protein n=1 Tax=Rhizobium favelukesii TaxID=348824 RepID=W6RQN5_9HYPH|nr:hypothetical protein LPU83_pLPU83c_0611 [Rhizobium favelukesii]
MGEGTFVEVLPSWWWDWLHSSSNCFVMTGRLFKEQAKAAI